MNNELIKIFQTTNTIKVFTSVSFILNLFNLIISPVYFIDLFIYSLGYYGAKYFSKAKLYMFFIFLVSLSIVKFIGISYIYFSENLMTLNKENIINLNVNISISLLSFLANIYISRFALRLYNLITNCSNENREIILMNRNIITPLSLW